MSRLRFFLILLITFFVTNSFGQLNSIRNHNLNLNLSNAIELTFTSGGSGISMSFNNANDYQNGITATNAFGLKIRSNKKFNITVKSATTNFISSTGTTMPVSNVLYVKRNTASTFVKISTTNKNLITNQNRGIQNYIFTYKANPGFNYNGGIYTANIIYTATQL